MEFRLTGINPQFDKQGRIKSMRVYVFSHIRLFSEALAAYLESSNEISEVTACHRADHLVDEVLNFFPDIVLIDVTIECALIEARAVSDALPGIPIVAVALPENAEKVIACADAGLAGYISRQESVEELVAKMLGALRGECVCTPSISGSLLREVRRRQEFAHEHVVSELLTQRECEILRLLGRGLSNKRIAFKLDLSVATVKNHVHNIFAKLHIHSRGEALARLRDEPWIAGIA